MTKVGPPTAGPAPTARPEPAGARRRLAPSAPPIPPAPWGSPGPARRRLLLVVAGVVLGAVLALVLLSATSSSSGVASGPAPGIDTASANLLGLDVLPNASRVAPNFDLVDQYGRPTSLNEFRGKAVVWSLNDDKCTDLCELFAQDVVAADRDLGAAAKNVVFLSVNANPFYPSPASVRAWSVQNDLEHLANWVYVTGTPAQLKAVWAAYHVTVQLDQKDRTVVHDATVEFINPSGRYRAIGDFMQGSISTAYYAHTMAQMADDLLPARQRVPVGGTALSSPSTQGATIGDRAPGFALAELGHDHTTKLASFEGRPLVVNFWASTCSVCAQEMPALQRVYADFRGHVNFIGVDVADPRSAAATFARAAGVRYPLLADHDGTVAAEYRVDALPVTFIVASNGTILARHQGALTHDELVAVLDMDFMNLPQVND